MCDTRNAGRITDSDSETLRLKVHHYDPRDSREKVLWLSQVVNGKTTLHEA